MSGCEEEEANREFEKNFMRKHPDMIKNCFVASDTAAPLYTACPRGTLHYLFAILVYFIIYYDFLMYLNLHCYSITIAS